MESVPFWVLHGVKVTAALVAVAAGLGVWRYLRQPARRARRRRRDAALLTPARLNEVAARDVRAVEGRLVAENALDVGLRDPVAVASAVSEPGPRESRRTVANGPMALDVEGQRVSLGGPFDLRAGSREHYPRLALAFHRNVAIERLRKVFGRDFASRGAPAILALRAGDRVRAYGRVEAAAGGREAGYRESAGDWRMHGGDGELALWHPPAPRAGGNTVAGALWRALWTGGAAFALIVGAAHIGLGLASRAGSPATVMGLAELASLAPGTRHRAAGLYADALEKLEPSRARGRAIAGLHEVRGICDGAARVLFARQDLDAALEVSERCPGDDADRVALGVWLVRGDIDAAARSAEELVLRHGANPDLPLRLALRGGRWEQARRALRRADARASPERSIVSCLDAWLAAKLDMPVGEGPDWYASHACMSLRADQLAGRERLEFLGQEWRGSTFSGLHRLLALEAAAASDIAERAAQGGAGALLESAKAAVRGPADAPPTSPASIRAREAVIADAERLTARALRDFDELWAERPLSRYRVPFGLLVALGHAEGDAGDHWDVMPALFVRAAFAALAGEDDEARRLAGRARASIERMEAYLREHEDTIRGAPSVDVPRFDDVLDFIAGQVTSPGDRPRPEAARDLIHLSHLAEQRRRCAANEILTSPGGDPLAIYTPVCRGEPRAVLDGRAEDPYAWHYARGSVVAIAPVLGDAPALAAPLAAAPLLPPRAPPTDVFSAYALAAQMRLIHEALGHADRAAHWRERSRGLGEVLLDREPAVPLSLLRSLAWRDASN